MLCIHNQLRVRHSSSKLQQNVCCSRWEHTDAKVREMVWGAQVPQYSFPQSCSESSFLSFGWCGNKPCFYLYAVLHVILKLDPHVTSPVSVRNSGPCYLFYLHYYSGFSTWAVEMKLLMAVDVLCKCDIFQLPGNRWYTSKTTSVGKAMSWFYLSESVNPGCFCRQKFPAGYWKNRVTLHWWSTSGARTAAMGEPNHFLFFSSSFHLSLP